MPEGNDLQGLFQDALATGAAQSVKVIATGNVPFAVIPDGYKLQALDSLIYNEHAAFPERKTGKVVTVEPASFLAYWVLFHDEDSQAFAYPLASLIRGTLDYHGVGGEKQARWQKHTVTLALEETDEWKEWSASSKKQMGQVDFAEFLEDHAPDIREPNAATFVESARDLKATTGGSFKSAVNAKDGSVHFGYVEEVKGSYGRDSVEIPERFVISLPVYNGLDPIRLDARIRFRIREGKLVIWYQIDRLAYHKRQAFEAALRLIQDGIGKKVFVCKGE